MIFIKIGAHRTRFSPFRVRHCFVRRSLSARYIWYRVLGRILAQSRMSTLDVQPQLGSSSWASREIFWEMGHSQIEHPSPSQRFPLQDRLFLPSITDRLGQT